MKQRKWSAPADAIKKYFSRNVALSNFCCTFAAEKRGASAGQNR
jgi:hypothetical protein